MPWGNGGELEEEEAEEEAEEAEEAEEQVACGDDDVACAAYGQKSTEIRYEMFKCRADSVTPIRVSESTARACQASSFFF